MTDAEATEALSHSPLAEIDAMRDVAGALEKLDPGSRDRVLDWALKFYRSQGGGVAPSISTGRSQASRPADDRSERDIPDDVAELFARASPGTEAEKALVVGYWFLRKEGIEEFDSFRLNSELTHLGHRVLNITRALGTLMAQKPALVVQTRKEGKTKQARKKFRLTVEGIRRVERMMAGTETTEE